MEILYTLKQATDTKCFPEWNGRLLFTDCITLFELKLRGISNISKQLSSIFILVAFNVRNC